MFFTPNNNKTVLFQEITLHEYMYFEVQSCLCLWEKRQVFVHLLHMLSEKVSIIEGRNYVTQCPPFSFLKVNFFLQFRKFHKLHVIFM